MEIKTAGNIIKLIYKRNNLLNNKELSKKIEVHYDTINKGLRDDKFISERMINNIFHTFKDITPKEKNDILLMIDYAKSPKRIQLEIDRLKFNIEELEEERDIYGTEAVKSLKKVLNNAVKDGLLESLIKFSNSK